MKRMLFAHLFLIFAVPGALAKEVGKDPLGSGIRLEVGIGETAGISTTTSSVGIIFTAQGLDTNFNLEDAKNSHRWMGLMGTMEKENLTKERCGTGLKIRCRPHLAC